MAKKEDKSYLPTKKLPGQQEWLWADARFQQSYPALYELLARGFYQGEERKGASLTLFVSDGRLKASVNDRQTHQIMWLTLEPREDVLSEVEAYLENGTAEWRSGDKPMPKGTL